MPVPLKPIFKRWNPDLESWQWGLNKEDFGRVQAGMACERCLEPFESFKLQCPVCKHMNSHIVIDQPEWRKQGE